MDGAPERREGETEERENHGEMWTQNILVRSSFHLPLNRLRVLDENESFSWIWMGLDCLPVTNADSCCHYITFNIHFLLWVLLFFAVQIPYVISIYALYICTLRRGREECRWVPTQVEKRNKWQKNRAQANKRVCVFASYVKNCFMARISISLRCNCDWSNNVNRIITWDLKPFALLSLSISSSSHSLFVFTLFFMTRVLSFDLERLFCIFCLFVMWKSTRSSCWAPCSLFTLDLFGS